jgi:uncharacterized membrane protein YjgN (DUF898 family)
MTYFRICLRTFLLAIVTFGIYDAWGTVERKRYRLGHTQVAGHGFDYHAQPMTILKGRLIAIGVLILFQVLPIFTLLFFPAIIFAIPWIINRQIIFTLGNTSYRNVRFDFQPNYWKCFFWAILAPLLALLSLGFAAPWIQARFQEYFINNSSLGGSSFRAAVPLGPLYKAFIAIWLISIGALILIGMWLGQVLDDMNYMTEDELFGAFNGLSVIILIVFMVLGSIFNAIFFRLVIQGTKLEGGHRFDSHLPAFGYARIAVSRGLLATVSFGLLIPWATIQIRRYILDHMTLLANGDLDEFVSNNSDAGGAAGAEYGAMEGISSGVLDGI